MDARRRCQGPLRSLRFRTWPRPWRPFAANTAEGEGTAMSLPPPPPAPVEGPWRSYKEKVALLADRIIELQKPIRILNALKWESPVWEGFRKSRFKEPPEGRRGDLPARGAGLRPSVARGLSGPRGRRAHAVARSRRRHRANPPSDLPRVPRRVPHARGARDARVLRLLSSPLRLAQGHLSRRQDDAVRDIARTLYTQLTSLDEAVHLGPVSPRVTSTARRWSRRCASASARTSAKTR